MLSGFLLAFREGLEAALIISIVLGVVIRLDRRRLVPSVWLGTASGAILSMVIAIALARPAWNLKVRAKKFLKPSQCCLLRVCSPGWFSWMQRNSVSLRSNLESKAEPGSGPLAGISDLLPGCSSRGCGIGAIPPRSWIRSRQPAGALWCAAWASCCCNHRGDLVPVLQPPRPAQVFSGHKYPLTALRSRVICHGDSRAHRASPVCLRWWSRFTTFPPSFRNPPPARHAAFHAFQLSPGALVNGSGSVLGLPGCNVHHPSTPEQARGFQPGNKKSSGYSPEP